MKLIIAEKPSLARNIVEAIGSMKTEKDYYIGNGYIVTSVFGHLLTLYDLSDYLQKENPKSWELEDLNFYPKEFRFKIKSDKGVKDRYKLIKELVKRNDITEIVNGGDADGEGEVLINIVIYKIFDELKINKKITRIWLEDQTKETIQKELKNLKPITKTENIYREGLARTYIDWLYGIYLTRYISILSHTTYNTGRVIIPTVKFIYDRDMKIENFKPEPYYEIETIINKNNQQIKLNFKDLRFKQDEKEQALNTLNNLRGKEVKVIKIENKQINKKPNKLFSLATLQNYMSKSKKFSLDKTLKLVQGLYEKNYLTYPRTNTEYMSEEEKDRAKDIIVAINNSNYLYNNEKLEFKDSKTIFDSSKVESHSALTPTVKIPNILSLTVDEQSVYLAVLNRFVANFYPEECLLDITNITFELENMKTTLKGTSIKQEGYLKYENNLSEKAIQNFIEGENFKSNFELIEKETTPPNKVTEAELNRFFKKPFKEVKEDIEEDVEDDEDDEDYKKMLKGIEIGTPATRSQIVEKVKAVGYIEANKNILSITDKGISFINALEKLNINLYKEKTVELSQNLKKVNLGEITLEEIVSIAEEEIKEIVSQKLDSKISTEFSKSNNFNNKKTVIGKCPICGKDIIENSKAYGCSGYKEGCTFTIWKTIAGKNITKTIATELIKKGRTKEITGFKSKAGNLFSSSLMITEEGKITFDFNKK